MTPKLDEARLRELAEAATPGPWNRSDRKGMTHIRSGEDRAVAYLKTTYGRKSPSSADDAAFIAAANPATIVALLEALSAERERHGRAVKHLRAMSHVAPRGFEIDAAFAFLATQKAEGGEP